MTYYIAIERKEDLDWLLRSVNRWLSADPNNPTLIANYEHIAAWKKYLENLVPAKDIAQNIEQDLFNKIFSDSDLKKVTDKKKPKSVDDVLTQQKKPGRPPSKKTIQARQKAEKAKIKAEKEAKKKELESDPFKCSEHPTYGGKYKPRTDCDRCWEIFKTFHPQDYKQARDSFDRKIKKDQNSSVSA